jgi:protein O-GlcNAc transferase
MSKKVISYSLWGSDRKYTIGAIRNAELANHIYAGWISRFYIGSCVPGEIVNKLRSIENTELIFKNEQPSDWTGMFWRFEAAYDESVQVSIFRDTDSRLSVREEYAVDEWLRSDKTFHIMRDHPFHGFHMLGGMWGYKNTNKYPIKELLCGFDKRNKYGTDYDFFTEVLYPIIGDDKVVHDPFFEMKDFPVKRDGTEFVGDVFDEHDERHPEYHRHIR